MANNMYTPYGGFNGANMGQPYGYGQTPVYPQFGGVQPQNQQFNNEFKFMTESEIMAYVVNPNCRLYALDGKNNKFYIKATDSLGNSTIERYSLAKDNGETPKQEEQPKVDLTPFLTKDDFAKQLNAFRMEFDKKFQDVERIKKALGGVKENG